MIDELCGAAGVELQGASVRQMAVDLMTSEVVLDLVVYRVDSDAQVGALLVFAGVRWLSVEYLAMADRRAGAQRIDVGDGFPPGTVMAEAPPDDAVWVRFAESKACLLMRAAKVTVQSEIGSWTVSADEE